MAALLKQPSELKTYYSLSLLSTIQIKDPLYIWIEDVLQSLPIKHYPI